MDKLLSEGFKLKEETDKTAVFVKDTMVLTINKDTIKPSKKTDVDGNPLSCNVGYTYIHTASGNHVEMHKYNKKAVKAYAKELWVGKNNG